MRHPRITILCTVAVVALAAAVASSPMSAATAASRRAPATAPYRVEQAAPKGQAAVQEVTAVLVAPNGIQPNYTPADVATRLAQVDAYYANETNGFVHIHAASISDWQVPDDPSVRCDDFVSINAFALQYSGFTPGPNKHLMAMVPENFSCERFSNASEGDGVNDGGFLFMDANLPETIGHELGHNMSLFHASSVQCSESWDYDERDMPPSCNRDEYGNDADLMGHAHTLLPFTAGALDRLGLISHRVVPTCGATRRIDIQTMASGFDQQRIISWADPADPSVNWFVQYRDASDSGLYAGVYDSPAAPTDDRPSGVQISRTDPLYKEATSIAVRPGDDSAMNQRLVAGDSAELRHGMSVSVVALDEDAHVATVDVTVPCGSRGQTVEPKHSSERSLPSGAIMQQAPGMPSMVGEPMSEAMPAMPGMQAMPGMSDAVKVVMPSAPVSSGSESVSFFAGPRWNVARILRLPS